MISEKAYLEARIEEVKQRVFDWKDNSPIRQQLMFVLDDLWNRYGKCFAPESVEFTFNCDIIDCLIPAGPMLTGEGLFYRKDS